MPHNKVSLLFIAFLLMALATTAQEADTTYIVEDFSMYADVEIAGDGKRFITSKVFDQSPNKLISVGYDFQGSHTMTLDNFAGVEGQELEVQSVQGLQLAGNIPIVSKTNILVNLGFNYWESHYTIDDANNHPLAQSLDNNGLRTTQLIATIFKPLNEKNFLLIQASAGLSGDYSLPDFQPIALTRLGSTIVYGWKKSDRLMYGFGMSRSYLIGEANYVPVVYYYNTFSSRKWGIEAVLPARAELRRNFSSRAFAFFGYELQGQSYFMSNLENLDGIANPELRRGELRIRAKFEHSLKDFIWVSAQLGLRYNWNFNVDDGDIFRGFGDDDYELENDLSNALYFNISLNLVSP